MWLVHTYGLVGHHTDSTDPIAGRGLSIRKSFNSRLRSHLLLRRRSHLPQVNGFRPRLGKDVGLTSAKISGGFSLGASVARVLQPSTARATSNPKAC